MTHLESNLSAKPLKKTVPNPNQKFNVIFIPAQNQNVSEIHNAIIRNPNIVLNASSSDANTKSARRNQLPQQINSLLMSEDKDQAAVNRAAAQEASEPDVGTRSTGNFGDQMQPKQGRGS